MSATHVTIDTHLPAARTGASSRARRWTGRALTAIAAVFLTFDAIVKLANLQVAVDANAQLGYRASLIVPIGALEVVLLAIYLVPRTSIVGAILWTGYLGGAIASQLRAGNPLLSNVLFPIYVAVLLWGGLWLRDARVRGLLSRPEGHL